MSGKGDTTAARKELFEAVETIRSTVHVTKLLIDETDTRRKEARIAAISAFTKPQARRFFGGILELLEPVIEEERFLPDDNADDTDDDEENEEDMGFASNSRVVHRDTREALGFLKTATLCTVSFLEGITSRQRKASTPKQSTTTDTIQTVEEVFLVAQHLHNCLFALQASGKRGVAVQTKICQLCELWWKNDFMDRECLIVELVPLLLAKSMDVSAQKADVKRLLQVRDALDIFDFASDTSADLKSLLLRTVSSPLYLKIPEGKRWISHMLSVPELIQGLHNAIRVQVPDAKATILHAYADIYFRAWKEGNDQVREQLEDVVLQDLAFAVIHVADPQMVKSVQTLLQPFYDAKKTVEVEQALYRLFGPILWRSLSVANPTVRSNASRVLAEVFPLQEGRTRTDKAVSKSVLALENLLKDKDPHVRVAASEATARILGTYWDVVPASSIRTLLNRKCCF